MSIVLKVVIIVVLLLLTGFIWGYVRIKKRQSDVNQQIFSVREEDLETLTAECISVFSSKLGKNLDPDQLEASARILDEALMKSTGMTTISAFERPGHPGWFVKPMGAFLGELVRRHAHGRWVPADGGGLAMVIGEGPNEIRIHPFDKIEKQRWSGDPGDLVMYVMLLEKGPAAIDATLPLQPASTINLDGTMR